MRIPWLGIHIVRETGDADEGTWASDAYVRLYEMIEEEGEGSRYLGMMYAAFVRECKIPAQFVGMMEASAPDGRKLYRLIDVRDFTT